MKKETKKVPARKLTHAETMLRVTALEKAIGQNHNGPQAVVVAAEKYLKFLQGK